MQASLRSIVDIIGEPSAKFVIPIFQRVYSWSTNQCDELFKDVMRAASNANGEAGIADGIEREAQSEGHFLGTVLIARADEAADGSTQIELIDGQQRMVTTTLLLLAIRDRLAACDGRLDGLDAQAFEKKYLRAADGSAKLDLSADDAAALRMILDRVSCETPAEEPTDDAGSDRATADEIREASYVEPNYEFFLNRLPKDEAQLRKIWRGVKGLIVVCAQIEEMDEPQLVFESLNSRGKSLSTTDLIRNLLFLRVDSEKQQRLFAEYWEPVEDAFKDDSESIYLDAAIHAWLERRASAIKIKNRNELYRGFKSFVETSNPQIEGMLSSLSAFCVEFSKNRSSMDNKKHVDWALGKLTGLISERRLFGD